MDLQTDINWILSEVAKVKDPELITAFKSLLKYRAKHAGTDWWDEICDEEKADIEEGLAQIERGETVPHEEVMAKYKKWL